MRRIIILDMTSLFKKEMLLYSLFDLHFKTPIRIVFGLYLFILLAIWGVPLAIILWPLNGFKFMLVVGVPILLASLMSKPIWGGKSFASWARTQVNFILNPRYYYDSKPGRSFENEFYKISNEYSVSRARDFNLLYQMDKRDFGKERK